MKIEQQVCNLELAKKLKKLGVEQKSYFYWDNRTELPGFKLVDIRNFKVDKRNSISAFTATELLEMLPSNLNGYNSEGNEEILYDLQITKRENGYVVDYQGFEKEDDYCIQSEENLCNALAKMLIYLKENNLI